MYGYSVFNNVFLNLMNSTREIILKNIFSIEDVSNYYVSVQKEKICFRFFSMGVFYQFVFHLDRVEHYNFDIIKEENRLVDRKIYIDNYIFKTDWVCDYMSIFVKILLSKNEKVIYSLISLLL